MTNRILMFLLAASLALNLMALIKIDQLRCKYVGYTYKVFGGKVKCGDIEK